MDGLGRTIPETAIPLYKRAQPRPVEYVFEHRHRLHVSSVHAHGKSTKARRRYPGIRDGRRGVVARPWIEIPSLASGAGMTTEQGVTAPPATYRRLLRVPGFRQLLISSLLTRTASQMWTVGLVIFALQRFHSPGVAGVSLFLLIFPGLLLSPITGALLDRHGRKRLMTLDFIVAAVCLTVIVVLAASNRLPVWGLYTLLV